jgi:hypothetical protein
VEAGEAGGILESLLDRLAIYQEKMVAIKQKIKSALMYPVAVLVVACARGDGDHDLRGARLRRASSPTSAPSCPCPRWW